MPLQDKTSSCISYSQIYVNDLLSGSDRCNCQYLSSIQEHLNIPPARVVFAEGSQPTRIFIHRSGSVLLFEVNGPMNMVTACPVGPNQIFGLIEAFSGHAFKLSMKTVTNSEFDVIRTDDFLRIVRAHPALCFRFVEILSLQCQIALKTIKSH